MKKEIKTKLREKKHGDRMKDKKKKKKKLQRKQEQRFFF